jgi:hypothetical protein
MSLWSRGRLLVGLLLLALPPFLSATAHAAPPARTRAPSFAVEPAAGQPPEQISRGYFWLTLLPGQQRTVQIAVRNTARTPLSMRMYPVDGLQIPTGGLDFTTWGKPLAAAGTWVSLGSPDLVLAPGQARRVTATIRVPQGLPPGQYVAGTAFEDTQMLRTTAGPQLLIDMHYRHVLAVVVNVPGRTSTALTITGVHLATPHGTSEAVVDVRNPGNLLVNGQGTLEVTVGTSSTGKMPFSLDTLLPAHGAGVPIQLPGVTLKPGTYGVSVHIQAPSKAPLAAWQGQVTLSVAQPAPAPIKQITLQGVVQAASPTSSLPWLIGALLLVLAGAGAGTILSRRAGRRVQ